VKYSSTAVIPEAVADLMKDPANEEKLLFEILKNQGKQRFVTTIGTKEIAVSTASPDLDDRLVATS
jgi:hypothetical protein